jgi:hypothetical protein
MEPDPPTGATTMDDHLGTDPIDRLTTAAIFVAPALILTSTLVYGASDGMNRGQVGGALQLYAWSILAIAIVGLALPLRHGSPRTAATALGLGLVTAATGASYGVDSMWAAITAMPQLVDQGQPVAFAAMAPPAITLVLTFLILGVAYARSGLVPAPVGYLLALVGPLFPAGRATNILPIAVLTDLVLLAAMVAIGRSLLAKRPVPATAPATAHG